MIKTKKILLGSLSTMALVATPIATVVSCNKDKEEDKGTPISLHILKNVGVSSSFSLLEKQDGENIGHIFNIGKGVFSPEDSVIDATLKRIGKATLNVTLGDVVKKNLMHKYDEAIKKGKKVYIRDLQIGLNEGVDSKFFEKLTTPENAKKLAYRYSKLLKSGDFHFEFNLILPKWLNKFGEISYLKMASPSGESFEKVKSFEYEKGAVIKIKRLDLSNNNLTNFDPSKLPLGIGSLDLVDNKLTSFDPSKLLSWTRLPSNVGKNIHIWETYSGLYLSKNNLTTFDATKLPSEIENLHLYGNKLTTFDATKLPSGLKTLWLFNNQLTTFDATKLPSGLDNLKLSYNQLTTFDATKLPSGLRTLWLADNKLTTFDTTNLPSGLTDITLSDNSFPDKEKQKLRAHKNISFV